MVDPETQEYIKREIFWKPPRKIAIELELSLQEVREICQRAGIDTEIPTRQRKKNLEIHRFVRALEQMFPPKKCSEKCVWFHHCGTYQNKIKGICIRPGCKYGKGGME